MSTVLAALLLGATGMTTAGASTRTWSNDYDWNAGHGYVGWSDLTQAADPVAYSFASGLGGQAGLWLWPAGSREHRPGYGEWAYAAPGTTRLRSATFAVDYDSKLFAHHCLVLRLDGSAADANTRTYCSPPAEGTGDETQRLTVALDGDADAPPSVAAVRVEMPQCANPADTPCSKYLPPLDPLKNGPFTRTRSVRMILTDSEDPTVTATGAFPALDGQYIAGTASYRTDLAADDPGSGVRRIAVEEVGVGELASFDAPCDAAHHDVELDNRVCPAHASADRDIDTRALPEGTHRFRAVASDLAQGTASTPTWTVMVDRTGPPPASNFATDYDDETSQGRVLFTAGADPALADGTAGSGTLNHLFRYRRTGGDWTAWAATADGDFAIPDAQLGDAVDVEVQSSDAVGNLSTVAANHLIISQADTCVTTDPAFDTIDERTHLGALPDDAIVDVVTFAEPVSQSKLLDMLPPTAKVASVVEQTDEDSLSFHASGMTPLPGQDLREALAVYNETMSDEADAVHDYWIDRRAAAGATEREDLTEELAGLARRRAVYDEFDGVPIKSVALYHDGQSAQSLITTDKRRISDYAMALGQDSEGCDQPAPAPQTMSALSLGDSRSEGTAEKDWKSNSYSPPSIRVETYIQRRANTATGKLQTWHEVMAHWRWGADANRAYWLSGPRRNDYARGFELQVDLNRESNGEGGPFGYPVWGAAPAYTDAELIRRGLPTTWGSNMHCRYLDDYYRDDLRAGYSLTVGSSCRPPSGRRHYYWFHDLVPGDVHDRVTASVQPEHIAQVSNHIIVNPFVKPTEFVYCGSRNYRVGSCFFGDIGVPIRRFDEDSTGNAASEVTPGAMRLYRHR